MTDDEWELARRQTLTNRANIGWLTLPGQPTRAPKGMFKHGTRYGFDKKKCRCQSCMEWRREYQRRRYWIRKGNQP